LTPTSLASLTAKQIELLLMDYVTSHSNFSGGYIGCSLKAVKSWLAANDIELRHNIKIRGVDETPSLREERIPTKDELRRILLSATKQSRVAVALMGFGGLRPEVLGDYQGRDGLRLGDLPEIALTPPEIKFEKVPTVVVVRPNLSKARNQYFSFLGDEACSYIIDYLSERLRHAEELNPDSPVIRPKYNAIAREFVRTSNVGDMIRNAIRRSGLSWRPYVLRCYFDTQLLMAESKGCVVRDYRMFWMGHKGDIESRYTTNKGKLPDTLVDDMREAYGRSQEYLQTIKPELGIDKVKEEFKRQLLAAAGFSEKEIVNQNVREMSDEELHALVRQKLLGAMSDNGSRQRVVGVHEVERYLTNGWDYVASLNPDKAIVKIPF
jgi:hypothetical protein